LLTDRDVKSNLCSGPSIYASYQVSVHLAKRFQRRRLKCEKSINDRRRTTDDEQQVMAKVHIKANHTKLLYTEPLPLC